MYQVGIAAAVLIAVVAVAVPFAAIVLVSIASRREEAAHSLSGQAPGALTRMARRLLSYRTEQHAPMWSSPDLDWDAPDPGWPPSDRPSARRAPDAFSIRLMPRPEPIGLIPSPGGQLAGEVRFGHARRSLPAAGQLSAGHQSQPDSIRTDQRQGAGV